MKKILFLIETMNGGGAERVLTDLVNNLDPQKYDITIQTIWNEGLYLNQLNSNIHHKSVLKSKLSDRTSFFLSILYFIILSPKWVYNKFIKDEYDIEIAFLEGISTKYIGASTNKKAKKYAWVHIDLFNFFYIKNIFFSTKKAKKCYCKFDKILCVSNTVKSNFYKRFGLKENVEVVYNVVDDQSIVEKAQQIPEDLSEDTDNRFKIITVGRLTKQKGYDRLLRVHSKLIEDGFDYTLWIIGEGEDRGYLESIIKDKGIQDSTKLFGFKSNPYPYIKYCDLFVCSSLAEGFSLVVAESLILGVPVLSTNCAGPNELLNNGEFGLLVDNNENSLYEGLKKILNNPLLYENYKCKAKERGSFFKKKICIDKIEKLLDN